MTNNKALVLMMAGKRWLDKPDMEPTLGELAAYMVNVIDRYYPEPDGDGRSSIEASAWLDLYASQ